MPARRSASQAGADPANVNAPPPPWQRASVEKSLNRARERAQQRSDHFVAAAMKILDETGDVDFTVQDVVDRSKMSIRTFYAFFGSKDDLLVALHARILEQEVIPRLRTRCELEKEPLDKLRAFIDTLFELSAKPSPGSKALTKLHYRLAEARPEDLEWTLIPQVELVVELVEGAVNTGWISTSLEPRRVAQLFHRFVQSAVHSHIFGTDSEQPLTASELWDFCAFGLGVKVTTATPKAKRRRAAVQ